MRPRREAHCLLQPGSPSDGGEAGYEDVPLFISVKGQPGRYIYFGTYSQTRWSDRVSYDVLSLHVPEKVKGYWAGQLADPARPEWVTRQLMKHFFPMPEYDGPMPAGTPTGSEVTSNEDEEKKAKKVTKAVKNYVEDLKLWEKEASTKVGLMNKENMMTAFDKVRARLLEALNPCSHILGRCRREPRPASVVGISRVQAVGQSVL